MSLEKIIETQFTPGVPSTLGSPAYTVCTIPPPPPAPPGFGSPGSGNGGGSSNMGGSGNNQSNCTWVVIPPDPNCRQHDGCNGSIMLVCP